MKLILRTIIFFTLLSPVYLKGQDTISVYFESGHSKLTDIQFEKLDAILTNFDLSDLDSVHYIGMTDSVGNSNSNYKLSRKRAKNVFRYCKRLIPENIPTKIIALGEMANLENKRNRRVNIILFFNFHQIEDKDLTESIEKKEACYNVDYELLHRCHLRTITKRKKELIIIETSLTEFRKQLRKQKKYYYGSITNNGDFITKKVKWRLKRTGNFWWAKSRYVAEIPKSNFDTYKIFTIGELPCDTCNENFKSQTNISKNDTCTQVDRFLMENIQFKTRLFNNKWVKIRTPREYVIIDDNYYIGCGFQNKIAWQTKNGRKKQNYYYSRLPRNFNYIANITRVMDCCKNNPEPSECDKPIIHCATLGETDKSFLLNAEIGSYYQQSTYIPYAGIGISKEGFFSRLSILAGTDIDLSFHGSLRYQYHFLSFPFSAINPMPSWKSPTEQHFIKKYGRLYLGTEVETRVNKSIGNYLEQNAHIGLAIINTTRNAFIPRMFIQYGFELNFLGNNSSKVYPIVQIGLNMKIVRLLKFRTLKILIL